MADEKSSRKDQMLDRFKRFEEALTEVFSPESVAASKLIVGVLKEKELTYEEAYAALELAYRQLQYESNFLKLSHQTIAISLECRETCDVEKIAKAVKSHLPSTGASSDKT